MCAEYASIGRASLTLYDVTTLYYESDEGDEFRKPGFSKESRIDPQITVGMLTDKDGFPLRIAAFEGNKAETNTFSPSLRAFIGTWDLADVTVVVDAGMISVDNKKDLERADLSYILGANTPEVPYVIDKWRQDNPGRGGTNIIRYGLPVINYMPDPGARSRGTSITTALTGPGAPAKGSTRS